MDQELGLLLVLLFYAVLQKDKEFALLPVLLGPAEGPGVRPGLVEGPRVGSVAGTTVLDHVQESGIGSVASNATLSPVERPGVGSVAGPAGSCGRTRSWVCCPSYRAMRTYLLLLSSHTRLVLKAEASTNSSGRLNKLRLTRPATPTLPLGR